MECGTLSAEDNTVLKIAIEICNNPALKREILCAPGSDYGVNKVSDRYDAKKQWEKIVEKKVAVILKYLGVAKQLQEKVMGIVLLVGMRMLTWAEYHEGTFHLSREFSINFLNSSFFTTQGIIDNKKAAEELMKDKNLSIKQKYKLACLYCFTESIPDLHRQMTMVDKGKFYDARGSHRIQDSELVKFWSYYLMGEIDQLKGGKSIDQYRLEKAIESGSKTAVEYCLEKTNLRRKKNAIIDAAIETARNRTIRGPNHICTVIDNIRNDWICFRDERYDYKKESWIPSDYYVDILYFLFSKMKEDQQIQFLKKDIEGINYKKYPRKNLKHSRILEYFLNWPYQNYFMRTADLTWDFLPERSYADLLLEICHKIEPKDYNLRYGEEKSFDYKKLLRQFWFQSPEHYKRYVLSDKEITYKNGEKETLNEGKELLIKLFGLKIFTNEDKQNIMLILASATGKEKENIISSKEGGNICISLMKQETWEKLDEFVSICFPSKEQACEFMRNFISTKAQHICIYFAKNDNWNAAESFIKYSALSEEEINQLKRKMIYSDYGKRACRDLVLYESVEIANRFCKWCFSSEEEARQLKKILIFSQIGVDGSVNLIVEDKLELVDKFISWCLFSQEEIREFKKDLAYREGDFICVILISDNEKLYIYDEGYNVIGSTIKFKGGKWEQVEKFLTWCFSSEQEISNFKNKLFKMSGVNIHFNLIESSQWKEAETFFSWLCLSAEEIKDLKKETLFYHDAAIKMFTELMHNVEVCGEFGDYGSKQEAIELLLRWYLTDKETVLEFKDKFKREYQGKDESIFKFFYLMLEQRFRDLDEEEMDVNWKSEKFLGNKIEIVTK